VLPEAMAMKLSRIIPYIVVSDQSLTSTQWPRTYKAAILVVHRNTVELGVWKRGFETWFDGILSWVLDCYETRMRYERTRECIRLWAKLPVSLLIEGHGPEGDYDL
jgi:hypothetical protein